MPQKGAQNNDFYSPKPKPSVSKMQNVTRLGRQTKEEKTKKEKLFYS